MEQKVDFHIHTYFSDGSASPTDIVKKAKELDYDMIAITDHDGTEGIEEAFIAGKALDLQVIAGIELATETDDGTGLHILGYHIDTKNDHLQAVLKDLRKKRIARNEILLQALSEMGYPLTEEDLILREGQTFIGKATIARAMAAKGYISHYREAFYKDQLLDSPEIRKIKKEKLTSEQAISLIKEAGGISVLAHPIQIRGLGKPGSEEFYSKVDSLLEDLKRWGIKGLECFHPDQNHKQSLRFVELAEKYHLHITKGSDFHGVEFGKDKR